jgi:S-adenosyl methyltransferase
MPGYILGGIALFSPNIVKSEPRGRRPHSQGLTSGPVHEGGGQPSGVDVTIAHNARVWNYWLGGKDNFEVDRAAGDQVQAMHPGIAAVARADRAFLGHVVRYLVGEAGIRLFLDIGTGLPTAENTHQVAEPVDPRSRLSTSITVVGDRVVGTCTALLGKITPVRLGAAFVWVSTGSQDEKIADRGH